jgi:hypothetical protein
LRTCKIDGTLVTTGVAGSRSMTARECPRDIVAPAPPAPEQGDMSKDQAGGEGTPAPSRIKHATVRCLIRNEQSLGPVALFKSVVEVFTSPVEEPRRVVLPKHDDGWARGRARTKIECKRHLVPLQQGCDGHEMSRNHAAGGVLLPDAHGQIFLLRLQSRQLRG